MTLPQSLFVNRPNFVDGLFELAYTHRRMKFRQLTFHKHKAFRDHAPRFEHGGGKRKGLRKLGRPFSPKKSMHLTLRSVRAVKSWSFLKSRHERKILKLIYGYGARFNVRIFRYANAGNHLHLLLKADDQMGFQNFLRAIGGMIPRIVTGAQKGNRVGKFWDGLAYSKLVHWGRHFRNTSQYVVKNTLEAFGIIPPRKFTLGHTKIDFEELLDSL